MHTPRYTLGRIVESAIEEFLGQKGFFYTSKELFLRPGRTIECVLSGRRDRLNEPLKYLILTVAAIALVMNLSLTPAEVQIHDGVRAEQAAKNEESLQPGISFLKSISRDEAQPAEVRYRAQQAIGALETSIQASILHVVSAWYNVVLLLAVPIYALVTWLLIRGPYNFAEHLVIHAYIYGVQCVLAVIILWPAILLGQLFAGNSLYLLVSLAYQVFAWIQVFPLQSIGLWLRAAIAFVITFLAYGLVCFALVLAAGTFLLRL